MKLLIINDLVKGGGVERVMLDLLAALNYSLISSTVLCTHSSCREMNQTLPRMVKTISLAPLISRGRNNRLIRVVNKLWHLWQLRRMRKTDWDVVLAFKEGPSMLLASTLKAKKKIGWVHVDYRFLHWTKSYFPTPESECNLMQKFDSIVCVSQAAADSLKAVVGDPGNVCVRYNPLNAEEIRRKAAAGGAPVAHFRPLFVAVGRLDRQKNFQMLVDCAAELLQEYDFELHIIGDGPLRGELQEQIDRLLAGDRIKLLGNKENPYSCIRPADWFLSTSICESYGLAIQEALILGVPVIATRCPAINEVCDPRFCLLADNSLSSFRQALLTALRQPELREQYCRNIQKSYPGDIELYQHRIQAITSLWN